MFPKFNLPAFPLQKKQFKRLGCFLSVVIFLAWITAYFILPLGRISRDLSISPRIMLDLIRGSGEVKQTDGRTNFLILGIGAGSHEGAKLSDSIIFVSFHNQNNSTLILSLPRDIWLAGQNMRINNIYLAAEEKSSGSGLAVAGKEISAVLGQPIHYTAVINFDAFKKIINFTGGVDIYVERTFDDYKYPKEDLAWKAATESGEIYEHLHFDKGWQHMDGLTALKFSRSRHSADINEGTDYARSKRQQKLIMALKDKVFSLNMLSDIPGLEKTFRSVKNDVDTDISPEDFSGLARLALKFDESKLRTLALDEGTEGKPGFLVNPPVREYQGAWVLVPRSGDWKEFQEYLKKEMAKKN